MSAQYVIGIDLGTTNSVLAYVRLDSSERPDIVLLPTLGTHLALERWSRVCRCRRFCI